MRAQPRRIGVLMGGQSAERGISLKSGEAVYQALRRRGHRVVTIDADASLPWQLRAKKVEVAFLALHGPGGEDGTVQGLLEVMGIPYTGSGVRASAVAMDKGMTRAVLQANGIPIPRGVVVKQASSRLGPPSGIGFPMVVKPCTQGSTIGVSIVRTRSSWRSALRRAFRYDQSAVVEAYIEGRELAVAVFEGQVWPPVEIVAPGGFYDFAAKYRKQDTRYVCPAPVDPAVLKRVKEAALSAYGILGCSGAARVDVRLTPRGRPFILEINTLPGMTERSLLPMAAAQAGLAYEALVERMLEAAVKGRKATRRRIDSRSGES